MGGAGGVVNKTIPQTHTLYSLIQRQGTVYDAMDFTLQDTIVCWVCVFEAADLMTTCTLKIKCLHNYLIFGLNNQVGLK